MSVITDPDIIQYRCAVFEQKFKIAGATYVLNPYKYPGHSDFVINFDDVMDYRCVIRMWVNDGVGYGNPLYNEKSPIFKCYHSIEDMVKDGWKLD